MMRFFVNKKEKDFFVLDKEVLNHIKVSRVTNKKFICVYEKIFYICQLEGEKAKIIKKINENHEFSGEVILAAALINIKRFEWLIQKACELGATKLIPVLTKNVEQKLMGNIEKKVERWNQIAIAAAEQSFRNKSMEVKNPLTFQQVLEIEQKYKYIAHEKVDKSLTINNYMTNCIFLVGPEGGFTEEEIIQAKKSNFQTISLGKRILRSETASIYLLSKIVE